MSVDKLVDSTQLDSDLTSVANAIRAKSGGSSSLAFPSGFVSEIQAIPSGGGGASYTELSAVSIKNSSDTNIGKQNNVFVSPHGSVKKFEVEYKDLSDGTNDANDIVIAKASINDIPGPASPYVGYKNTSGVTMSVKTEVNGYAHLEGSFNSAITQHIWVGSWNDATYSKTNAFKYVKFWDNSDNLTHHLIPVLDASNVPCFYDLVNKDFYYLKTGRAMISGEAVL